MSTFKQEELDIESFLNLDGHFSSSSLSSAIKGKAVVAPEFQTAPIEKHNTFAPLQTSQNFSGPSHQYDLHKQHIPLPPGALANSLAAAQRTNFSYGGFQDMGMGSNSGLYDFSSSEELFDLNTMSGHNPSFSGSNEMDMDFDSPVEGLFSNEAEFIDPNAIGGQEEDSPIPSRAEIVRAYPGMHAHQAQQAALAKQQQQIEIQRQQQMKATQRPQSTANHKSTPSRSSNNRQPVDPVVEERISRLLSQMRQSASGSDEGSTKQSPQSNLSKSRKAEEDMDEDERLLASEEGKKLSSKERRQLRNKVSARAFRSRRKGMSPILLLSDIKLCTNEFIEYISQLEGEVATKSSEADNLRIENDALRAENTRLTDLTKLLLSSAAFSTFLNDLSTNGLPPSVLNGVPQASPQSQTPKQQETSTSQSQYQMHTPQVPMTIQESQVDFSDSNSSWNSGLDFSFTPQIFTVMEIPQEPVIEPLDTAALSGKSGSPSVFAAEPKELTPVVEVAPVIEKVERDFVCNESVEFDESDPAFALFTSAPTKPSTSKESYEFFGSIRFEKAVTRYDLVSEDETESNDGIVSAATMARFESICSSLDSISQRLEGLSLRF
jgi:hypothetical protein